MAKGEVVVTSGKQNAVVAVPDFLDQDMVGAGLSANSKDSILPWLVVLQKNSPQVNKKDPGYIQGAEAGMVLNRATGQVFDAENEGIRVVPCAFQCAMMEWAPRLGGGGKPPIAMHPEDTLLIKQARPNDKGVLVLPNGNELIETAFEIILLADTMDPAVISMAKSARQASRRWMALKRSFKLPNGRIAPAFSRMYLLKTKWTQNDKGDWYNYEFSDMGWLTDPTLYNMAKELYLAFDNGDVQLGRMEDADGEVAGGAAPSHVDDGIPI